MRPFLGSVSSIALPISNQTLPCQVLHLYLDRYVCAAEAWKGFSIDTLPTASSARALLDLGMIIFTPITTPGRIFLRDPFGCAHIKQGIFSNHKMQAFLMRGGKRKEATARSEKQISIGREHG